MRKNREIIGYGLLMAVLFLLLRWIEFQFIIVHYSFEIYAGIIALLFTVLGIWLSRKLSTPKTTTVFIEKNVLPETVFERNQSEIESRKISKRELEVLGLMAKGMSNSEIADSLFVSQNTIKTHTSNLFEKLEAKRRTQAVEIARKLKLVP